MTISSVDLMKSIVLIFNEYGLAGVNRLGQKMEVLSKGVSKFSTKNQNIAYFILFERAQGVEISFLGANCQFHVSDIEKEFGKLQVNYNFRENYSEFKTSPLPGLVNEIFFIKDNKWEFSSDGQIVETTPYGKSITHSDSCFDGFCLRLRNQN